MGIWTEKPSTSKEIYGQPVASLKTFIENYTSQKKKAALVHGPTGCGKTSSVHAIANELGLEIIEVNASDSRNKDSLNSIVGSASQQMSLFSKGKVILVDEIDGVAGRQDRGAVPALVALIKKTKFPVVFTANDPFASKFSPLRRVVQMIEYNQLEYQDIYSYLELLCKKDGIEFEKQALESLARRADGDMRAAMIDLFLLTRAHKKLNMQVLEVLDARKREVSLKDALTRIFKTKDAQIALSALNDVGENIDEVILWIEENLPKEYSGKALDAGFDALSKADVFRGRIRRRQYWRFLVYVNTLITAGIAISKTEKNSSIIQYEKGKRILKMWIWNRKNQIRKSIAEKLAKETHCSKKYAFSEVIPYFKHIFSKKGNMQELISEQIGLDEVEVEWLHS